VKCSWVEYPPRDQESPAKKRRVTYRRPATVPAAPASASAC